MKRDPWMELEMRHFAALDAVSAEGSFRGAADRLGYVQSAISQQIAYLERVVGSRLIERSSGPGPVVVTPAGQLVLRRAREIVAELGSVQTEVAALAEAERRTVRLGIATAPVPGVLAALVAAVHELQTDLLLDPRDIQSDKELVDDLAAGRLDVALVELPAPTEAFAIEALTTEPYRILAAPDALPRRRTACEVAANPVIAPPPTRSFQLVEGWFRERGMELSIAHRSSDAATIATWTAAGLGLALVPSSDPEREWPGLVVTELDEELPSRTVGLAWSATSPPTPAARTMSEAARLVARSPDPAL